MSTIHDLLEDEASEDQINEVQEMMNQQDEMEEIMKPTSDDSEERTRTVADTTTK